MEMEIKIERQEDFSQKEIKIMQALEILQETCLDNLEDCGRCPLWSMSYEECIFSVLNPSAFGINPNKIFRAIN